MQDGYEFSNIFHLSQNNCFLYIIHTAPPSTPRMVPTPTVDPASLPKPPSCVLEPPVMDVNNLVSSVVTRMDSKSAPSIIRRMVRSVSMLLFRTVVIPMRWEFMLMRMRHMIMTVISRCTSQVLEISCTPRMMVSRGTILMELSNVSI